MLTAEKVRAEDHIGLAHAVASQFVDTQVNVKDSEEYAEACLLLVEAAEEYVPEDGSWPAFAWAKMRNGLTDAFRYKNRKKRKGKFKHDADMLAIPDRPELEVRPDEAVLYKLLADCPDETEDERADKLLLIEVHLGGGKVSEIAERLGVTRERIYQRLRRAIDRIRGRHASLIGQFGEA